MGRENKLWLHLYFISIWKQQEGGDTACVCICVCKITIEAKYMGLYLLTLLMTGEGFSHAQRRAAAHLGPSVTPWPFAPVPVLQDAPSAPESCLTPPSDSPC